MPNSPDRPPVPQTAEPSSDASASAALTPAPAPRRTSRDIAMVLVGALLVVGIGVPVRSALTRNPDAAASGDASASVDVAREAAETIVALASEVPAGTPATSKRGLGAFPVRNTNGETVPIINVGEPAIVMINSRTCGYCKAALRDLGVYAKGRPVPRLRLLTLEGAADGLPMLAENNIGGAVAIGPATSQTQVLITFRYRGTPTFVAVGADGTIQGTMAGYPGPAQLMPWFDVMLGERAAP